ncbi:MAG: hypothetical protein ACRDJH_05645 [Thermomicrobiales bacterium]
MNGWKLRAALLAVLVGFGVLSLPALPTPTASASNVCYGRNVHHSDPFGFAWTRDQVCPNASGAPLYYFASEDPALRTGTMYSTNSWFVCYVHGDWHAGGNDVWYYTQGDEDIDNGLPEDHAWGFMPARYVWTNEDPDPGMPPCP